MPDVTPEPDAPQLDLSQPATEEDIRLALDLALAILPPSEHLSLLQSLETRWSDGERSDHADRPKAHFFRLFRNPGASDLSSGCAKKAKEGE